MNSPIFEVQDDLEYDNSKLVQSFKNVSNDDVITLARSVSGLSSLKNLTYSKLVQVSTRSANGSTKEPNGGPQVLSEEPNHVFNRILLKMFASSMFSFLNCKALQWAEQLSLVTIIIFYNNYYI